MTPLDAAQQEVADLAAQLSIVVEALAHVEAGGDRRVATLALDEVAKTKSGFVARWRAVAKAVARR